MKTIMRMFLALLLCFVLSQANGQKFENLAERPPMGWNSWNKFGCEINEKIIKEVADAMTSNGMKAAGYEYIVIDDCWQIGRDSLGNILADPDRFPSGISSLVDYVHANGLKFGIYSDAGTATCQGRPGSRGYEFQDARTYAKWNVDYLKYDWCFHGKQNAEASYTLMRDAIYKAGRPMVLSICEWGTNKPWEWGKNVGHLWRTTEDIINCFDCKNNWGGLGVLQIIDLHTEIGEYSGPGHWNDPDMLEIGNGVLTPAEERLHLSMWAMFSAPLMAGNDIRNMSAETLKLLTNKEVLEIDQDKLGISATRWMKYGDLEIWFKPLSDNNYAFCFINRSNQPITINHDLKTTIKKFKVDGNYKVRDVWKHKDVGTTKENVVGVLPAHDVIMLKLTQIFL
ncbi:glycoside hydrolase family 27 protein [Solitalea canadensis]|uniref:Alpha-galactosidase n=1 Tax=Solitalea canadensis (strain ATCC 29591 / DSM 3403 / JCM 21819 / LMG 8368 / NBRC 15130 / NCIMB 12057 / USAM 9D) TaxID=929556 RepID=H8KQH3_SOLCM|nr:glycoside hydrolase family 27 protein [Solitalea canadensis]AFD06589.1 alpha-galactosidase [Solitalea canadensis DSM 3403]